MAKRIPFDVDIWKDEDTERLFKEESDRGAVMLFAAVLDNQVGHLLHQCLVKGEVADRIIFGDMQPLQSFGPRSDLVLGLGLITAEEHAKLVIIRKVRNRFAHHPANMSFADAEVKKLVDKLPPIRHVSPAMPRSTRNHYLLTCARTAGALHAVSVGLARHGEASSPLLPLDPTSF